MSKDFTRSLIDPQSKVSKGKIRLAGVIEHDNIVNGPGLRAVIWS